MFDTLLQQTGAFLTIVVTILALWLGGRPERIVALASVAAFVLSPLVQNWSDLVSPQWGIAGVDGAMLVLMTGLLLKTDRRWIIAAWAFSALTVLAHVAKLIDLTLFTRGYIGTLHVLYFGFLLAQAAGVAEAWRVRRRKIMSPPS